MYYPTPLQPWYYVLPKNDDRSGIKMAHLTDHAKSFRFETVFAYHVSFSPMTLLSFSTSASIK